MPRSKRKRKHPIDPAREYVPAEAAIFLGLRPGTVKDYCRLKWIAARKPGREWLITGAAINEYNETRRPQGRPKKEG